MLARGAKLQVVELAARRRRGHRAPCGDADRLDPDLRRFLEVPFLLWAYARARSSHEAARNRGQIYRLLVDDSLFGLRKARPSLAVYDYELVKKPVLAWLAARMTADGQTLPRSRSSESRGKPEMIAHRRSLPTGRSPDLPHGAPGANGDGANGHGADGRGSGDGDEEELVVVPG
jgi:hypothetical protein